MYKADEEYNGPPYASQPMITGKHVACYTPPGWKRKRVKFIFMRIPRQGDTNLKSQNLMIAVIFTDGSPAQLGFQLCFCTKNNSKVGLKQ